MRELVYDRLVNEGRLDEIAEGLTGRIYPTGSLGVDPIPENPERPYIQYGFESVASYTAVREGGGPKRYTLRVYVYDDRGDYIRVDEIHRVVRETVEGLTAQISPSGVRCTDALWLTLGGDLTDNVRNLAVKMATFRLVAR